MMTTLMQVNAIQEDIISKQAQIIDKLFTIVCEHCNYEELEGMEAIFASMQDAAERTRKI